MQIIRWTNKYSGETGYVASVSAKEQHFNNTYNAEEAKRYSEKAVKGVLTKLNNYGECDNNDFEFITVE